MKSSSSSSHESDTKEDQEPNETWRVMMAYIEEKPSICLWRDFFQAKLHLKRRVVETSWWSLWEWSKKEEHNKIEYSISDESDCKQVVMNIEWKYSNFLLSNFPEKKNVHLGFLLSNSEYKYLTCLIGEDISKHNEIEKNWEFQMSILKKYFKEIIDKDSEYPRLNSLVNICNKILEEVTYGRLNFNSSISSRLYTKKGQKRIPQLFVQYFSCWVFWI